jgi:uncharacterized protein YyaL (SSP411 family)
MTTFPPENLLGRETSPYLLQHADNPVHWRAWGDAAFAEARTRDVPILLSVGYAACHWCHVMAHESFEDEGTAKLMNELFVNVKVDREERPDVDNIYMNALHLMGEQGGWPLTMFLTPDGEPFWGGTYFPPDARYGRPGFQQVLHSLSDAWKDKRDQVKQNTAALVEALKRREVSAAGGHIEIGVLDQIAGHLSKRIDPTHGGLQGAPKFPQCSIMELLWRAWLRSGRDARGAHLRHAVQVSLDRMCQGGIYDHVGGGLARYSTDEYWLVPHFEKMLYDNAELVGLLTLAWQTTKSPLYEARVAETIDWLQREMMAEADAFAASLDADSEGEEGKFYVWTAEEIDSLLGSDAAFFKDQYGVSPEGNWEGHTILCRTKKMLLGDPAHEARLAKCRAILLAARAKRVRPGRDDKVLADWNGLMITALAHAGFAFQRKEWIALAERALAGVLANFKAPADAPDAERMRHSFRQGRALHRALLDDYANTARAAVALYEVTGKAGYLAEAERLVAEADRWYWDQAGGGYFFTASDASDLLARTKTADAAPTPSGNGIIAHVLGRLYFLTGKSAYRDRAEATVGAFAGEIAKNFFPMSTLMNAAEFLEKSLQVAIIGTPGTAETDDLLRVVAQTVSLPNLVLQIVSPGADLPDGHPARGKGQIGGAATAYVCDGPVCSAPVTEPARLAEDLKAR